MFEHCKTNCENICVSTFNYKRFQHDRLRNEHEETSLCRLLRDHISDLVQALLLLHLQLYEEHGILDREQERR